MSLSSDFWKELAKLEEEDRAKQSGSTTTKATGNSSKKTSGSVSSDFWKELVKADDDGKSVFDRVTTTKKKKKKEDIAPVQKKRTWFDTKLFDDGYDFGDVTKTILGTSGDILENLASGVAGMGEKAVDALAYIAPFAANAQFHQNGGFNLETEKLHNEMVEQSKKDIGKFIAKDLYDEEALVKNATKAILGVDTDDYSILGEKSDSLVQSGGQLLATAGLQAVGVPWFLTTGATSFGSEAENAMNQGATYEEAGASAAISAGAEILSEKLSGGILFGGKALDDSVTKLISRSISNKAARTFAKLGLDMVGEGAEEVFSQVASNLGSALYKDESLEELLWSEEAFDEYLESFIGGAALGGVFSGYNAATSKGDYASGLTDNEYKVVDQLYKERVSEAGEKVSQKEKSKIYDQILSEMEKGYISTDDIERILGGETYNAYKNTVDSEDSVLKEFEELGKKQNATLAEQSRYAELKEQVKNIRENSQRSQLQTKLSEDVLGMLEGDRLLESYNERSRRGQAYEADLTQYDSEQQKVIQKAAESGVLNNTRRTHEFVDIIAKISADKGVLFDFTNNAKLKESGFAVEGKTVNGYVTKEGITLNVDSPKAWQSTVGHEITHVLEGTELYDALKQTIFDYAKSKGDYQGRYDSLAELYKGVKDADVEAELAADLVGDYLFQDADFINNLSTTNRNVFQKIYDEIKYLYKVATAGSKEARELEKVKKAFDKAYREGSKNPTDSADIRYSLSDSNGRQLSSEQAEFFKDSKVKDENGNLKVMYHGTPNGDFTVFKDGTYFTDSKEYADRYQNPGASSISTGKVASAPKTFEVYLDIKKPFDINDAEAREIYINDYIKGGNAMGINPYLSDAEYAKINSIDWTEGEDLREFLIENEYDYDGLVLDEGATGGYGDEVKSRGKSYVVFSPEQVKNIDNQSPTSDTDIRFSLSKPVEETKDLLAVHNLTSEQLLKSMELGGLPMPSIAVLKADSVHDEYGEVSLILHKGAIDPKANKANKVYGGDAWTPVYPRIEYKPSEAVEKKISDKYYGLAREIGYDAVRPLYNYVTDLERQLNNASGEAAMLKELYDDTDMMNLYLQDSGKGKIDPIEKETVTKISLEQAEMNQFFIDALGEDVISSYPTPKGESIGLHRRNLVEQHGEEIKTAYKRFFMERYDFSETEADNALDNTSKADLLHILRDAYQYTQNKGVTVKTEIDSQATQKAIREAAADGYKAWVDGLFKGVEEKTGIRNNQDYYTRTGNPRSWDALHWANTLENVVKVMKGQEETGTTSFSPYNSFASLAHKRYGSIAEVKADSNRLGKISEEEYEAMGDSFAQRFVAIANSIKDPGERNPFIAADNAAEAIVDAVRTQKSKAGILKYLQEWSNRATKQTVEDIVSLVNDIANMPTGYFEAKPKRAVGFDEVGVFVIPYDADVKLKQELLNRGYSIAEYDPKVEGDRQRVVNQFEDLKFSLSNVGEEYTGRGTPATELRYEAPVSELVTENTPTADESSAVAENATVAPTISEMETVEFPDDLAPVQVELDNLQSEADGIASVMEAYATAGDIEGVNRLLPEYEAIKGRIRELQQPDNERVASLEDADAPPETEKPISTKSENYDPFSGITVHDITRSTRSYSDRNPGARHFLEEAALGFGYDVNNSTHGERWYNDQLYYESGGEKGFGGTSRHTTSDIEELKDTYGYTWDELGKAADNVAKGDFRSVAAKRVEFLCHKRLMEGYTDVDGRRYPPNQEYITFLNETFAQEQRVSGIDDLLENADAYAPPVEDIAPVAGEVADKMKATADTMDAPIFESKDPDAVKGQTTMFEPPKPNPKVASVLAEESQIAKEKSGIGRKLVSALVDKGMVFENYSHETGNHEIQAKWNSALSSNTNKKAQYFMENGAAGVPALKDVLTEVNKSGKKEDFFTYMYHAHNVDRMTLEDRFNVPNKTVYGETVTADVSREKVKQYERANPEFKGWAEDFYAITKHMRRLLVDDNIISQETADLWEKMYPHYVPVGRVDANGKNITVPLDTKKTGVNAPIKRAKGGSSDMRPLDVVLAERIEQTYSAIARNRFGIELKNTMGTTVNSQQNMTGVDEAIDTIEAQEDHLLKAGTMSSNPTFTVFENGERVEFEITDDMYDALKPAGGLLGYRNKAIKAVGDARRNLLTQWNPVFALYRNPIKDLQEVAINSQHALKTYMNIPRAITEIATDGDYAAEYHENGGKGNSYFDSRNKKFKAEDNAFKKLFGMPLRAIESAGEFIEEIPRLAEYIASRQEGRSIDRSMLDAARVTTNFAAGGDFTKFLNSHGFTFLNASVQGVSQHARNFREAKEQGLKGYVKVLAKYTIAGLPGILLNNLIWDDDEDYEELNDYVKQNYYVVAKTEDGKFIRIPKGRTAAVMQELMEQMKNLVTGDDEADFGTFYELFMNNIAPNNPIENNILAPFFQTMNNEAWYGGDLVPSRLQKLPAAEQFDESTDSISKWLGEKTGWSPYKINYLLDQYSGGLGDMVLPMLTPEAESGDNSLIGNILAPWKKEITTDKVLNNKNPGDFYDLRDELEVLSNSKNATEEDSLRSMYMDSVSWEMSDLYARKREIQSSDLPDDEKYEAVREIQEQINELAKNALDNYDHVSIDGLYSEAGDRRYNKDVESGKWYEIKPKNADGSDNWYYQKEQEVTKGLGISYEDYWNNREEYNFAYDKPGKYAIAQAVGGYDSYMEHYDVLENWQSDRYLAADKDSEGNSISGSRKEKVKNYINGLDIDYGEKIILYRTVYESKTDKRTYNPEIVSYLNSRDDISYWEMKSILEELGMEVDDEGNVSW